MCYRPGFAIDFTFNKINNPRVSLSSNVTNFLEVKLENIFINVSLKIDTCLGTLLLQNVNSQLTDSIDFLIPSTFNLLHSQTKRSYGDGYLMLRLSLQYVI